MRKTTFILPAVVVVLVVLLSSVFVVDEREKALVLQFGQIRSVKEEPGGEGQDDEDDAGFGSVVLDCSAASHSPERRQSE